MFSFKSILPFSAAWLVLCLLLPVLSYGQNVRRYTGPFQVGDYSGVAEFRYYLQEGDTIFNGPFRLQRSDLAPLTTEGSPYFLFRGQYEKNAPVGNWQFQFGDFQASKDAAFIDYEYSVKVKGTLLEASGGLANGKFQGEWTHTVKRLEDSKVDTTLFLSTIQFVDGYPQKSFRIENDHYVLLGRVLRDGLAHDVWELYDKTIPEPIEYWHFAEGRLEKIDIRRNGETESLEVYRSKVENPKVIDLDERYASILALQSGPDYSSDTLQKSSAIRLLTANAANYQRVENVFSELGDPVFISAFKVEVAHFPLTEAETGQLDSIRTYLGKTETISHDLLDNTRLQLMKLTDEEVLYLLSAVKSLHEKYQSPVRQLIAYYDQDILKYVPKENLLQSLWPQGMPSATMQVSYNYANDTITRTFTGPGADDFKRYDLASVKQLAKYTFQSIDSIRQVLDEKLMQQEQLEGLEETEDKLIAQMTQLGKDVDSLSQTVSDPYRSTLQAIKATANDILKSYTELNGVISKSQQAGLLITCLDQMDELVIAVSLLPAREDEIMQHYTSEVWNPFTFTYMNEKIKRPVTSAYQDILIPYLLEKINTNLSCDNIDTHLRHLEAVYQRTLAMKDENTGKVERKLKRERDPEEVLQLFDVSSLMKQADK